MNKEDAIGSVGVLSTIYSYIGPATEILQFLAVLLGVVATIYAIVLYHKKLKAYKDGVDIKNITDEDD